LCSIAQNLMRVFPSIHSGDNQWQAIHRHVASISNTRVLLPAYKQPACWAVRRCINWSKINTDSISVYLFRILVCHTRLETWRYDELNPNCLYADNKNKWKLFLLYLYVMCFKFLDHESLQLLLNCETFVRSFLFNRCRAYFPGIKAAGAWSWPLTSI
jgi:hypothetical protein